MKAPLVLVTGATDGIGKETVRALVRRGARVLVHGRRKERVDGVLAALREEVPGADVEGVLGDLSSLRSVRALAASVKEKTSRLDVLLHNAGVFENERVLTEDGFERTFAVNHLAHFLLTALLLPLVEEASGRVVTVSSVAHRNGRLDLDNLQAEKHFDGYGAYARSKLANVVFAAELARRASASGRGVTSNSLHPGVVTTKLLTEGFGMRGTDSVGEGAATSVFLALDPSVSGVTGRYFVRSREAPAHPLAADTVFGARFWELSEGMVGALR